jgi:hypothetical protein
MKELDGWTLVDWVIRPSMLVCLNFLDDRIDIGPTERDRRASLLFRSPERIVFRKLERKTYAGWKLREIVVRPSKQVKLWKLIMIEGGTVEITAKETSRFLWGHQAKLFTGLSPLNW